MADLKEMQIGSTIYNLKDATARNLISAFGSGAPIPVSSVSEMVDTSKIYLYTSESVYNPSLYEKVIADSGASTTYFSVTDNNDGTVKLVSKTTTDNKWRYYSTDSCSLDIRYGVLDDTYGVPITIGHNSTYFLYFSQGSTSETGYPKIYRCQIGGTGTQYTTLVEFSSYGVGYLFARGDTIRVSLLNGTLKIINLDTNTTLFEEDVTSYLSGYTAALGFVKSSAAITAERFDTILPTSQFLNYDGTAMYPPKTVIQNSWYYHDGTDWVAGGVYGAGVVDIALNEGSVQAVTNSAITTAINSLGTNITTINNTISAMDTSANHWRGKQWYAYGTSITNISNEGKYATKLAQMSGLILTNKGISGGGIGNLGGYSTGQVYSAICNITDGKLNADLITLETGANDTGASVPLGTIYDTGTATLAGCLNDCLRYLQENTNAQIVVFNSPASKAVAPNAANQYYEWAKMVQEICNINRVHFVDANCNLGYAKLASSNGSLYVVDNIHQTELGGYIYAETIWSQLKHIPLFYTALPSS